MSFDLTGLPSARKRWPKRHDTLPAAVQTVFDAWDNCLEQQQDDALGLIEGYYKPPGRFSSRQKSRDLTLLRSPLPSGISVQPLSADDVAFFFGETAPPPQVTPKGGGSGSDAGSIHSQSVRSSPADDRMASMEASLAKCMDTIAKQNEQLSSQAATLERLFKAQADPDEIQSSNYEVADSVLSKLGRNAQGKMSWLDIKPLPKSERRRIIREQGGTFSTFPPDLDLLASTKALKLVQEAKLTLPNFATQEVAKYMARNAGTIRMCGTVLSRVRELQTDLSPGSEPGEDRDSDSESVDVPASVPSHVLLEFLHTLEAAAAGAIDFAIDTQTLMRISVSRRIESALGVAHLHQDPTKQPKEDFMSPKTLTLIEDAAKMREDLTWAMEAQKSVTSNRNSLFGNRLPKAPGGGGPRNHTANSQRGQGRGAGGKGSGTGKGKGSKAKWDKAKADAESDTTE